MAKLSNGSRFEMSKDDGTTWIRIQGVTDLSEYTRERSTIDVTTLEDEDVVEIGGIGTSASLTFTGYWVDGDVGQALMLEAFDNQNVHKFRYSSKETGKTYSYDGLITAISGPGFTTGSASSMSGTITTRGKLTIADTPAGVFGSSGDGGASGNSGSNSRARG